MTNTRPRLSATDAMGQASSTASIYLNEAIRMADVYLGEGYAKKNPSLLAALVSAQVEDFNTTCLTDSLWEISDGLKDIASSISYANND